MSGKGKGKRRSRGRAWSALLGDDLSGVTELETFRPVRMDGVEEPATGAPWLIVKSAGRAQGAGRASGDRDLVEYAARLAKSADSQVRRRAEDLLERLGAPAYGWAAKSHGNAPDVAVRVGAKVVKSEAERRFTLCVGYPAWGVDRSVAQDGHRDTASAAAVEQAAWDYLAKHRRVGLWHDAGPDTEDAAEVVESYIWRGRRWRVNKGTPSEYTVHPGDWLIGLRWTPQSWELVKSGRLKGVSMMGSAVRRQPSAEALARLRERGAA